jgi:hypothetical protein
MDRLILTLQEINRIAQIVEEETNAVNAALFAANRGSGSDETSQKNARADVSRDLRVRVKQRLMGWEPMDDGPKAA